MIDVLVVDDDFMVARVHCGYVERVPGFRVVGSAHTAAAAVRAVAQLRPQLVLLDIYLPDRSGLDVLAEVRAEPAGPDVIVVTAARDVETVRRAMHGGVASYLVKPFTFASLRDRLEQYAKVRDHLRGAAELDQAAVDRVFDLARAQPPAALPKGLSATTCDLVAVALRAVDGDVSADEMAALVGISRVSARRYLEHLCHTGQARVRSRYGGAGRPQHRYTWASDARPASRAQEDVR